MHLKQVTFKTVTNGYILQYFQQKDEVAVKDESIYNTLGQLEAAINKLDESFLADVRATGVLRAEPKIVTSEASNESA